MRYSYNIWPEIEFANREASLLSTSRIHFVAPFTAAALIAQQVGANAARDWLFLSSYPVTSLPYFVAAAALIALPAAQGSGRLLLRFGPARLVPFLLALSAALFVSEWLLLGQPRVASVLLYMHSSVLGAIAVSAFWSLLNERFDPHSAKAMMARVAGAATLGGLIGGIGAERVGALLPSGALLLVLGILGAISTAGVLTIRRGAPTAAPSATASEPPRSAWAELRRVPLLRELAIVTALGAVMASLVDYLLKAEAVAWLGSGKPLVRFFGLFYAATGIGAFLLQATVGRLALSRLGLGGSVASHPVVVGTAGFLGFIVPAPWGGILPRALDMTLRNSVARAGYELLYTPLPQAAKRAAKSVIDVTCDSAGKGAGALLVMLLTRIQPAHALFAVNLAGVLAAAADVLVARRLRASYVLELEGGLRQQSGDLYLSAQQSLSDFTMVGTMIGMDPDAIRQALGEPPSITAEIDPVVAALSALRSGNSARIRATLENLPRDPALIGALVPLLANRQVLRPTIAALESFGPRAAGEMVSALLDSSTHETVQRRLPAVLKSCGSPLARDGLLAALDLPNFQVRLRATRALLALTEQYPNLSVPTGIALGAAERQLRSAEDSPQIREYVCNLLALALEREPMRIAAQAFESDDSYLRGTSLEYLETVLPPALFSALRPWFASGSARATAQPRAAAEVKKDLMKAGATMTMSLADVRRHLEALNQEDQGKTE
jgi:hypothetical protein